MATALQCPACGFKHRLDAVAATPVFPCSKCSRQLKLPAQYRNGAATPRPAGAAGAAAPGGAAVRTRTSAAPATPRVKAGPSGTGRPRLPLRILAWVVAFVCGALVVRQLAKWTGFVGGDTLVDLMIDGDLFTYFRLAVLVPVWAFFSAIFATVFIEAPVWWTNRRFADAAPPRRAPAVVPVRPPTQTSRIPKPAPRTATKTAPKAERLDPATPPRRVTPRPAPAPRARGDAAPAADQRPRRIPRRDTGS